MDITDLKKHVDDATGEVAKLVERQSEEIKRLGGTADNTAAELKKATERYDSTVKELNERIEDHETRAAEMEKQLKRGSFGNGSPMDALKMSAGDRFIVSKEFQEMSRQGGVNSGWHRYESLLETRGYSPDEVKAIVGDGQTGTGFSDASAMIQPFRDSEIHRAEGYRQSHVRDLLGVRPTTSNTIEFIQDNTGDLVASSQAGENSLKSQQERSFELKSRPVITIADSVPASRQVLEDAGQLRSYIDDDLRYRLMLAEDQQILYGDGSAGTLQGIFNEPIQDAGIRGTVSQIDHIRAAMRMARQSHYATSGVLMNPADWEKIETLKDGNDQYLFAIGRNFADGATPVVWRVPIVEHMAIAEGEFLLGGFDTAARLWDRRQAAIRTAEQHSDYFRRNMVEILAEERICLTVTKPKAFVKGSFATA